MFLLIKQTHAFVFQIHTHFQIFSYCLGDICYIPHEKNFQWENILRFFHLPFLNIYSSASLNLLIYFSDIVEQVWKQSEVQSVLQRRLHWLGLNFYTGGTNGKEPTCWRRRHKRYRFYSCVRKIPWRRAWKPTPVFLPGKSHEQRSLAGYSPWGGKELNMT